MATAHARILVVEDEALVAEEIRERLQHLAYDVVDGCDSSAAAMAVAERTRPDVIVMRVRLTGKDDGVETALAIGARVNVPVVFLMAQSDQTAIARVKRINPFGYVLKPFDERDLRVAIDLTMYRHQLEQELKASERRYAATLASVADGVIATDAEARVTFINRAAEALTQWSLAEARLLPVQQVVPLLDVATSQPVPIPVHEVISRRTVVESTASATMIRRDGTTMPVDYNAAAIRTDDGQLLGAVMAFRDLRQQRLVEDALTSAEDELRQSRRLEAVGRIAASVAHDFNNILTLVTGDAELALADASVSAEVKELLNEIGQAGRRGASLTRQLLRFSGKQKAEIRRLNVDEALENSATLLAPVAGRKVTVEFDLRSSGVISIDPTQFEVVLLNLVANAREAMVHGGRITIATRQASVDGDAHRPGVAAGRYVVLSVSHTETSIEQSDTPVFEPFFTTKEPGHETGLGLATVQAIVRQFGGHIDVERSARAGTTCTLYFPCAGALDVDAPRRDAAATPGGSETVLLVDDDHEVRHTASAALRARGYHVIEAATAAEALRIAVGHHPPLDLVIADAMMSDVDGPSVAKRLQGRCPGLRVLLTSGASDEALISGGFEPAALLRKPFTPSQLADKVRASLAHHSRPR